MSKKSFLARVMARLGYVPGPAKLADSICSLKIDIDSTSVDVTLAKLAKLTAATAEAEEGLLRACSAATVTAKALIQLQVVTPAAAKPVVQAASLATGSTVMLNSGGPAMTIKSLMATCVWECGEHTFPVECLVAASTSTDANGLPG